MITRDRYARRLQILFLPRVRKGDRLRLDHADKHCVVHVVFQRPIEGQLLFCALRRFAAIWRSDATLATS